MKIYLAGNIDGLPKEQAYNWRNKLKSLLKEKGYEVLVPKLTSDHHESVNFDKFLVSSADIILVKVNGTPSWGTGIEIGFAHNLNKPIVCFSLDKIDFHGWLCHHSLACLNIESLEEVVNYLEELGGYMR